MNMGFSVEDMLSLKPGGSFRVEVGENGRAVIVVSRPGEPVEHILCVSPGHANAARMQLSDQGLTGYVSGAL